MILLKCSYAVGCYSTADHLIRHIRCVFVFVLIQLKYKLLLITFCSLNSLSKLAVHWGRHTRTKVKIGLDLHEKSLLDVLIFIFQYKESKCPDEWEKAAITFQLRRALFAWRGHIHDCRINLLIQHLMDAYYRYKHTPLQVKPISSPAFKIYT